MNIKLIAIHKIGHGGPAKDGTLTYIEPGSEFEMEETAGIKLRDQGAARDLTDDELAHRRRPVASIGGESSNGSNDPVTERETLTARATELGITGIRSNTRLTTIADKIAAAEAEAEKPPL